MKNLILMIWVLESNNEIYNSIELSYYQFNPTKYFINSNAEIEISHKPCSSHINSQNLNLKLNHNMMLKNYLY